MSDQWISSSPLGSCASAQVVPRPPRPLGPAPQLVAVPLHLCLPVCPSSGPGEQSDGKLGTGGPHPDYRHR